MDYLIPGYSRKPFEVHCVGGELPVRTLVGWHESPPNLVSHSYTVRCVGGETLIGSSPANKSLSALGPKP